MAGRPSDEIRNGPPRRILLRCPEITLKGKNRGDFEHCLVENVIRRLRRRGLAWRVHYAQGRL